MASWFGATKNQMTHSGWKQVMDTVSLTMPYHFSPCLSFVVPPACAHVHLTRPQIPPGSASGLEGHRAQGRALATDAGTDARKSRRWQGESGAEHDTNRRRMCLSPHEGCVMGSRLYAFPSLQALYSQYVTIPPDSALAHTNTRRSPIDTVWDGVEAMMPCVGAEIP